MDPPSKVYNKPSPGNTSDRHQQPRVDPRPDHRNQRQRPQVQSEQQPQEQPKGQMKPVTVRRVLAVRAPPMRIGIPVCSCKRLYNSDTFCAKDLKFEAWRINANTEKCLENKASDEDVVKREMNGGKVDEDVVRKKNGFPKSTSLGINPQNKPLFVCWATPLVIPEDSILPESVSRDKNSK